jgi:hypothetical protein
MVESVLEREGEIIHVVAERLVDRSRLLGALRTPSRDFIDVRYRQPIGPSPREVLSEQSVGMLGDLSAALI